MTLTAGMAATMALATCSTPTSRARCWLIPVVTLLLAVPIVTGLQPTIARQWQVMQRSGVDAATWFSGRPVAPNEAAARIAAAQRACPPGSSILAVISHGEELDFGRNRILVIDHAGAVAPSGPFPAFGPVADLVAMMHERDIRFVMFSYGDSASYNRDQLSHRLQFGGSARMDRARRIVECNFAFRDQLRELTDICPPIHDDGFVSILDLSRFSSPSR